jgi:hypothetical protein
MTSVTSNPFAVQTPEGISAADVLSLFVDDFSDFHQILRVGHTFLHGARGSGKSMIFRFLEPDCQALKHNRQSNELEFFGFYIPVKETELKLTELIRLEKAHGSLVLNEHLLSINVAAKAIASLQKLDVTSRKSLDAFRSFVMQDLFSRLRRGGWEGPQPALASNSDFRTIRIAAENMFQDVYAEAARYVQRLSFGGDLRYRGALVGFLDFVRPFLLGLRELPFMPNNRPLFLLIDDADNLSLEQTKILNTWVASRGSSDVSLKVSTQRKYKTFRTITGENIETPHDFSEVEISDIYTSQRDRYQKRVFAIVEKRLQLANIKSGPNEFFPPDEAQEHEIDLIRERLKQSWSVEGRGARPRDDANRYARPDFIKALEGVRKAGSSYSYAGFDQLVHLSSGVVRYFLEPAALMFGAQEAQNDPAPVKFISPHIQDRIISEEANRFLITEFERLNTDEEVEASQKSRAAKLKNLIDSLGVLFHTILISNASERRVFSVAFSTGPDEEVRDVCELGVEYGYLHKSTIGKKEGSGRTLLYILSRRLAPVFRLDPTSFAGYKFITNETARLMISNPKRFQNQLRTRSLDEVIDPTQGTLFEEA